MRTFAIYKTKIGLIKIVCENNFVIGIKRIENPADFGEKNELSDRVFAQISEYLEGKRRKFELPIAFKGTPFQEKVWNALLEIPYGETASYAQIAQKIGHPKAYRAVGNANNKNPISIVIPCHRVIGANRDLVGYASGLEMKKFLLELEKINKE